MGFRGIHLRGLAQEGNNLIRFLFGQPSKFKFLNRSARLGVQLPSSRSSTIRPVPRRMPTPSPQHTPSARGIPWICHGEGCPNRMSLDWFADSEKNRRQNQYFVSSLKFIWRGPVKWIPLMGFIRRSQVTLPTAMSSVRPSAARRIPLAHRSVFVDIV